MLIVISLNSLIQKQEIKLRLIVSSKNIKIELF